MSMNRRRWSNKFIESMREFLNREEVEAVDPSRRAIMLTNSSSDTYYSDVASILNSPNNVISAQTQSSSENNSEYSLAVDNFNNDLNKNESFSEMDLNVIRDPSDDSKFDLLSNKTVTSNISDAQASTAADLDKNILYQKSEVDLIDFNESLNLNVLTNEKISVKSQFNDNTKIANRNLFHLQNFSSPEFQINKIDQPDVWDALVALEQELSPFDEREKTVTQEQNFPLILNRLSQKFKETPTKFTEKLVSIIEDSIVSSESPNKQNVADTSGISLSRMTGEFRKLCKFIDEESMPEWAPSLMNMTTTYIEQKKTPKNEKCRQKTDLKSISEDIDGTASQNINCKLLDSFATPKIKIKSNVDSPIKKFTPSMDKSFEYWEKVCNMMCENQSSGKKKVRRSISISESSKKSLNEMLIICERQMASLDDSIIDIRNSEPCKRLNDELKIIQVPRSKSESNIYINPSIEKIQIHNEENENDSYHNLLLSNNETNLKTNLNLNVNLIEEYKENDKKSSSVNESQNDNVSEDEDEDEDDDDDDEDRDCSLLLELAKRRQRCLATAKLMMEIDGEDPNTSSDNKCLETLYKLGVQDKSFIEDKDDAKFYNTLGHCLDYKKYFSEKSKPLINFLNNIKSPDKTISKATPTIKSKTLANKLTINTPASDRYFQQLSAVKNNVTIESKSKNRLMSFHNGNKITPKPMTKSHSKSLLKLGNKSSHLQETPVADMKPVSCGRQTVQRVAPNQHHQDSLATRKNILQQQQLQCKKVTSPVVRLSKSDQKTVVEQSKEKLSSLRLAAKATPSKSSSEKKRLQEVAPPEIPPRSRFFFSPGKSPTGSCLIRKKPASYFPDFTSKKPVVLNSDYNSIKSPINMYIHGTDNDLIQNVKGRTEDFLLTPMSNQENGKSPRLKIKLSPSKENKSPYTNLNNENKISTVRYQSANKVHLIDDKLSYSPNSLTPNSRTKKLLEPIENTVVIRHKGRIIEYSPQSDQLHPETSIRTQKMAEKTSTRQKKYLWNN